MDSVLMKKFKVIIDSRYGDLTLDILCMAAYLAPGDIRCCLFSQVLPDASDLKTAIQFLHRLSFVRFSDETFSFSVPNETRGRLRVHLNFMGLEEEVLKRAILLLDHLKLVEYPHLLSLYSYAKLYPSIQLHQLAVRALFCMLREQKHHEAFEFGTECIDFLVRNLGEYHRSVMEVQCFLAVALLAVLKRDEAIAVMADVYQKSCQVLEGKEVAAALLKLAKVVMDDPCSTPTSAEVRLRKIVFHGKTVSESCDVSDLEIWLMYSDVIARFGMTRKAVSNLDEVIERRKDIFGPDDDGILDAMQAKAMCLVVEFKLLEAMELSKSIFEKRKKKFGIRNLKTLSSKIDIARISLLKGEYKESMTTFEEVVKHTEKTEGDTHDLYLTCKTDMVRILRLQHDFVKALELSTELYDKIVSDHGASHILSYDCKHNIAEILMESGKLQEARKCFEELLEIAPLEDIEILYVKINLIDIMDLFNAPAGSLHCLSKEGQVSKVLSLLEAGQNIESQDLNGMTALHYASAFGQVQVAMELLLRGAKYNPKTPTKVTPLQLAKGTQMKMMLKTVHSFFEAVKEDNIDLVMELASKEPCVLRARDDHGCTCLHWAALRGLRGILGVLMELGADPVMETDKGNSPLHIAASKGHVVIAETLLRLLGPYEATTVLDGKTGTGGNTPLHAAAEKGFPDMVRSLLAHGAVYSAKNAAGKTPLQLSEDWGCKNILGLVEGLFQDVRKGDAVALCGKLRGLESDYVLAVSRASNEGHRTLMQETMRQKHVDLAKKLVKLLKYNS